MTISKELARQVLEALEQHLTHHEHGCVYLDPAVTALRQALEQKPCNPSCAPGYCYCEEMAEQPKQEPVAWWNPRKDTVSCDPVHRHHPDCTPLYTKPPKREWVGLSDTEVEEVSGSFTEFEGFKQGALWAEQKLKELNT